jgi:hypothetical protein
MTAITKSARTATSKSSITTKERKKDLKNKIKKVFRAPFLF